MISRQTQIKMEGCCRSRFIQGWNSAVEYGVLDRKRQRAVVDADKGHVELWGKERRQIHDLRYISREIQPSKISDVKALTFASIEIGLKLIMGKIRMIHQFTTRTLNQSTLQQYELRTYELKYFESKLTGSINNNRITEYDEVDKNCLK